MGFRRLYSTFYASISLTEDIRKNLYKGNIGCCGISVDLRKVFDYVEHDFLLAKREQYGICSIANERFKSFFFDRKQFVSNKASIKYGVQRESVP